MTPPAVPTAVPVRRALAGAVALLAVLAGVVWLTHALRHPPVIAPETEPVDAADPRLDVECVPGPAGTPSAPVELSSNEAYTCPQLYDGQWVRFEGEVVGAVLRRRDGAWIQLNDDAYAGDLGPLPAHREFRGGNSGIGVHLADGLADTIEVVGSYDARGDVVVVEGRFVLADERSSEVAVIRATAARIVDPGQPIPHASLRDRQATGIALAAAALLLLGAGRIADRWALSRRWPR